MGQGGRGETGGRRDGMIDQEKGGGGVRAGTTRFVERGEGKGV